MCLVFDDSVLPKKGNRPVWVLRQYFGALLTKTNRQSLVSTIARGEVSVLWGCACL